MVTVARIVSVTFGVAERPPPVSFAETVICDRRNPGLPSGASDAVTVPSSPGPSSRMVGETTRQPQESSIDIRRAVAPALRIDIGIRPTGTLQFDDRVREKHRILGGMRKCLCGSATPANRSSVISCQEHRAGDVLEQDQRCGRVSWVGFRKTHDAFEAFLVLPLIDQQFDPLSLGLVDVGGLIGREIRGTGKHRIGSGHFGQHRLRLIRSSFARQDLCQPHSACQSQERIRGKGEPSFEGVNGFVWLA